MPDKTLFLRNLTSQLNFIKSELLIYMEDHPDVEPFEVHRQMNLYKQSETDNYILFANYDSTTVNGIVNGIREGAYDYLIDKLNRLNNIFVYWSKIEGTTSDYTIFYNFDKYSIGDILSMDIKNIDKKLNDILLKCNNEYGSFKYLEVNDYVTTNMVKYF